MKLHFESDLDYQLAAIQAVCGLFRGQEKCRGEFTVVASRGAQLEIGPHELGVGNRLQLTEEELLENLHAVQLRNGQRPSSGPISRDFTVEMETGTGKTYVYLRTLFELNKQYGFTKFVIVVPSVAIREGVYASIRLMSEHFRGLYANQPFEYFVYDSSKLGQVRNFATSPHIQIMVVTVGAINKKEVNNLYKDPEKLNGERPIDLIRACCPLLIVDEPQSVDGGLEGQGRKALQEMNPLCTLRYSATHVDKHAMLYRLDAVDAYQSGLVKQIEVASIQVQDAHNKPYIKLLSTSHKRGVFTAKVELDVKRGGSVSRQTMTVELNDDLEQLTRRSIYANYLVLDIGCKAGDEFLSLSALEQPLRLGQSTGDVDADQVKRALIRRTILEHLDKELRLTARGIKVLSLFFIDGVEHYRWYDSDGTPHKGKYALMFEEEYRKASTLPKYRTLFGDVDLNTDAADVHNGYFSIDRRKVGGKTVEQFKDTKGTTAADEDTYALIMRDKEKLLSFDSKLKFIFSHSALREGWDNPNVFQICVLRDIGTELARRQSIGRGLRLCVNQAGARVRDAGVNTLTVMALEAFQDFADKLQQEIEADTGIRFGMVEAHQFARVPLRSEDGSSMALGFEQSEVLWNHLKQAGLIDAKGKVLDPLRVALKDGKLELPGAFQSLLPEVRAVLLKVAGKLEIKNADERKPIRLNKDLLLGPDFQALWDRIKHKTVYRVQFDNEKLLVDCARAIREGQPITRTRLQLSKTGLALDRGGAHAKDAGTVMSEALQERDLELPDLLTDLQDRTQLTRRSIVRILTECGRLEDFKRNPQQFIERAAECIHRTKRLALVDGIRYQRIGDDAYYAQELFEQEELTGYLKNMLEARKSVYEAVVYDSVGVEKTFAEQLERNEAVKVYAKLPGWFKVATPLGAYNPDWAILVDAGGQERLYFVVETKGSLFADDLRDVENAKIRCGAAHFQALSEHHISPAKFIKATGIDDLEAQW